MNGRLIGALLAKDVALFFRNRFFALVTGLALVAYIAIYFLLPSTVDESLEIALYAPALPPGFAELITDEGIVVQTVESEAALRQTVTDGAGVGVALPDDLMAQLANGERPRIDIFYASEMPPEIRDLYTVFLTELGYTLAGRPLNVEAREEVLGPDMAGRQIAPRDQLVPLFAIFLLMVETLGLASLISGEVASGTAQALLITPLRVEGLFISKAILGVGLAFSQAALLMGVTGGLSRQPVLVLLILLLGALLVTGVGFLMASVSRDMMSVMGWGVLAILVLSIPAFGVIVPGLLSDWVRVIPSYYLVEPIHRVVSFDAGWGDVVANLGILLALALLFLALGVVALRRKLR